MNRIFTGKEALYNELILKVLYEKGELTAWELSKEIAPLTIKKPSENLTNKARNIQSRLIGKQRRLENLVNNQFLKETENGYSLTFKGMCTASVLFCEQETPKPKVNILSDLGRLCPVLAPSMEVLSNLLFEESFTEYHIQTRNITNRLLDKCLKFEKIPNDQFHNIFDDEYQQFCDQQENETNVQSMANIWSPEVQEAAEALLTVANALVQMQAKDFDDEIQKFKLQKNKVNNTNLATFESCEDSQKKALLNIELPIVTFGQFLDSLRAMGRNAEADRHEKMLKMLFGDSRMEEIYNTSMDEFYDKNRIGSKHSKGNKKSTV